MTHLLRNLKTEVVHSTVCPVSHAPNCARWNWADSRSMEEVAEATAAYPWLHLCRFCLPGVCRCGRCTS